MKFRKLMFAASCASVLALSATGCKKCKNEDPRARIVNNGTQRASVQVKTSGGNTININNVEAGASSEYASYAPGEVTFTITVANNTQAKAVNVAQCYDYDIAIDRNNVINVTGTDRND